jgi:hypothetical protein
MAWSLLPHDSSFQVSSDPLIVRDRGMLRLQYRMARGIYCGSFKVQSFAIIRSHPLEFRFAILHGLYNPQLQGQSRTLDSCFVDPKTILGHD